MHKITKQIKEGEDKFEDTVYKTGEQPNKNVEYLHQNTLTLLEAIRDMVVAEKVKIYDEAEDDYIKFAVATNMALEDIEVQLEIIIKELK